MRRPALSPRFGRWPVSDGYVLRGRYWPPTEASSRIAVIYLHGIQSHGGWFEWSAGLFAEAGLPVLLPDRRGSGLNESDRGDTPSAERWLADVDDVAAWAEKEWGIHRFAVIGVSWGGKLAVLWSLRHAEHVDRLLLIVSSHWWICPSGRRCASGRRCWVGRRGGSTSH